MNTHVIIGKIWWMLRLRLHQYLQVCHMCHVMHRTKTLDVLAFAQQRPQQPPNNMQTFLSVLLTL